MASSPPRSPHSPRSTRSTRSTRSKRSTLPPLLAPSPIRPIGHGALPPGPLGPWSRPRVASVAARQRVLDAAERCIARDGLAATSVASVAAEAGVSRPTVYRYFDDRDALVATAMRTAADRLRADISARLVGHIQPAEALVDAVVEALAFIAADPVLRSIWDGAAVDGTVVSTFTGPLAVAWATDTFAVVVEQAGWSPADTAENVEILLRLALSLLVSPLPHRSAAELRAFLERRLLPSIGLAPPPPSPTNRPAIPSPERHHSPESQHSPERTP